MGYCDVTEQVGYIGGYGYLPTRAHEVEKLIEVAGKCGYTANQELFEIILDKVYQDMADGLSKVMSGLFEKYNDKKAEEKTE